MSDICLLVLSGLPAAGKTLFTNKLQQYIKDSCPSHAQIVVEYDKLMPSHIEKVLIESEDNQSSWKQYRDHILLCVDNVLSIGQACQDNHTDISLDGTPIYTVPPDLWSRFKELVDQSLSDVKMNTRLCVVIDDNMYYSSMRYKYYQLARKYTVGFCQVHLQTNVENALLLNSHRTEGRVNDEVIVTMATKMEIPDKMNNYWEQYSMILSNDGMIMTNIVYLIDSACDNPVQPVLETDTEERDYCRLVCSESFLHQSDQILRKLVSLEMSSVKDQFCSKAELKSYASLVQTCRKQLYEKLKSGLVSAPKQLIATVTDASKDMSSEMFQYLQDLFKIELQEINR